MKILVAASDLTPLLSPAAAGAEPPEAWLPLALQKAGHEVSVVGPFVKGAGRPAGLKLKNTGVQITVPLGHYRATVRVSEARSAHGLQLFLLRDEAFRDSGKPGCALGVRQAALFSKLIVELARRLSPAPNIVQIFGWPGALATLFLQMQNLPFASVLSISDPNEQGSFPVEDYGMLNLGWEHFRPTGVEFYGRMNFLKGGVMAARAVVVNGQFERAALQTPPQGAGLEAVFREQDGKLQGIPAGLPEQEWNPAKDGALPRKYQAASLAGKAIAQDALLAKTRLLKLPVGPVFLLDFSQSHDPLFVGFLADQLDQLLAGDVRFVVFGESENKLLAVPWQIAARRYPVKIALLPGDDETLHRLALAGADFQLFLGRDLHTSENILRSLRYGTLPIAPAGPGVSQLIGDLQPGGAGGNGLVIYQATPQAMFDTLAHRATALRKSDVEWNEARRRAMRDALAYTPERAAEQYVALYERLVS